jgi:fatty-acyl-CoA synthase
VTLPGLMQRTPLTLHSIFERMRTVYRDAEVRGPEGRFTYEESAERILRLARVLTEELGVRPGDRVASFGFNHVRHFELYYAVPLVGAVLHTVNIRLFPEQIAYIVNHAEDRVLFADGELLGQVVEVAPELRTVERYVVMGEGDSAGLDGAGDYEDLMAGVAPLDDLPRVDEDAALGLCYTSGTTGMPKGVLYSHRSTWLHAMAACMTDHLALSEHDRILPVVPMFHAAAWGLPYAGPFTGASLVLHGGDHSPDHLLGVLERDEVTVAAAVPTIWKELLPALQSGERRLPALRNVFVGGSALPRALIDAYDELGIELLQLWGMTETNPLACISRPRPRHLDLSDEELRAVREKTGTAFSGVEARVTDESGKSLPWDGSAVGELEVRGPWIAGAYYRVEDDGERFRDGWLRTGDMAVMEHDGYFRIVDRSKDLVKSGGEWVSSVELEGHLLAHPDVLDAAVIGLPSRKWDERPVAVVAPRPGSAPTLESIREFLAGRVAKWWLPDDIAFVDEIPKTSVGKFSKKDLRERFDDYELPAQD